MRAMPVVFPDDPAAWAFEEQYLLGPALFVAPVLASGVAVRFYLPAGTWCDLETEERVAGPRVMTRTVPVDVIPVYGREGFLLPLGPDVQHTDELTAWAVLNEVWAFGIPRHDLELPGMHPQAQRTRGQIWLRNLPKGTPVRLFGGGSAEVSDRWIRFCDRSPAPRTSPPQ